MRLVSDTYIKGSFRGWSSSELYELVRGGTWKLARHRYQYHYAYRPKAKLWQDGSRYYLEVEDMGKPVEVRRAR